MLKTGRYSSSKPNLQQIPNSADYRECFDAPPGKQLIIVDYSQVELRILACLSQDKELLRAYANDEDLHYKTAAFILNKSMAEITKDERKMAKPINFGFAFGMGPPRLVLNAQAEYGVTFTMYQAQEYHRRYFELYKGVARWQKRAVREGQALGVARSLAGRLRWLTDQEHNEYLNHPVQASNADGLKAALPLIQKALKKYGKKARLVHMVHDETITEVDDDPALIIAVEKDVKQAMEDGLQPFVPGVKIIAEPGHGYSWAAK